MKFIGLFIFILGHCRGNITKKMIDEVNENVLRDYRLKFSIVNPFFAYACADTFLYELRECYFGIIPCFQDMWKRIYNEDKPTGILSEVLINCFPSPECISSTPNLLNSFYGKKYFVDKESRSESIKVFSDFFIKVLKTDTSFEFNRFYFDKNQFFSFRVPLKTLDINIEKGRFTLAYTLITLNAFMLQVLDTKDELQEYVTNIINQLSEEDKIIIKTSSDFFLRFGKVVNIEHIFNILYNMPHCKFLLYFYKQPMEGVQIPVYNKLNDEFDEDLRFDDSVEITLLHLCNFLFYNEEKEQFDLEHLKLNENSSLLKFYTKYNKPFYVIHNIRNEWSKVVQCLNDIVISNKKCNENLGKIIYMDKVKRNGLKLSIFNIVSVLAKICSSGKNNIEKKYVELFDKEFTADSFSDLLQEFLKLIVNKSVDLKCIVNYTKIKDNTIYGKLNITSTTNNEKKIKREITYTFTKDYTNIYFSGNNRFVIELELINLEIKDDKNFNFLEYIIFYCVNQLKKQYPYTNYQVRNLRYPNNSLTLHYLNKNRLYYLFFDFNSTNLNLTIFYIVAVVVKSVLKMQLTILKTNHFLSL